LPPRISVVIPTKNERDAIASIVMECKKALQRFDHEVIVVDASGDNTSVEAVRAGAKVVKQIGNGGVGEALVQGFYWAAGEYIVFFDGDGTYDPADIHKLVEPLLSREADVVNGNRFANMEEHAMTTTNIIGNRLLTWVSNILFDMNIKDSQSGMKGFRREILTRMTLLEKGFPICSEILTEASKLNLRIAEVGITYRRRIGKSKLRPKIFWASLRMLKDYNPLVLFAGFGLVLMGAGVIIAWPAMLEYLVQGTFRLVGRALIAMFLWLTGVLCIFTGIILDTVKYSLRKIEGYAGKRS